jgi:hypothetical protein
MRDLNTILGDAINTVFQGFSTGFSKFIGALVVLLIGWILARMIRSALTTVLKKVHFDQSLEKVQVDLLFEKMGIKASPSAILAQIAYWLIMLIFLVAASTSMGWTFVSEELAKLIALIPLIISGLVMFVIGFYIAGIIRDVLKNATESLGVGAGKIIASAVYYFLMIVITLSVLEHIGMDISIISDNIQLIVGAVVIAGAISYGLASRDILSNTLSSFYGRKTFEVGQRIRVNGLEGTIVEISNISVVLKTGEGRTVIPSSIVTNSTVEILD